MTLYPLKFNPIYKTRIWGGHRLAQFGKHSDSLPNIGESWELSGVPDEESEVANGFLAGNSISELIEVYMDELVGKKVFDLYGQTFPLLIKLIDANDDLSIQVHPDDALAAERHNSFGKTEMWYALDGDKDATLISGFVPGVDRESYLKHLADGTLEQIMNYVPIEKGDVFFIPAGRVHAIGRGGLIAEIQQASDVTYRLFDFNRTDDKGNARELHTEQALDAIDFTYVKDVKTHPVAQSNVPCELAKCSYFTTNVIELTDKLERDYYHLDSFVVYMCTEGSVEIKYDGGNETMVKGETVFLPASLSNVTLIPQKTSEILEIYV
jgi:mannose-6-phosphate isomerase